MRKKRFNSKKFNLKRFYFNYVESVIVDKITLWMLRIILDLNLGREFLDERNNFFDDSVATFLGLGEFVKKDRKEFSRSEVFEILNQRLDMILDKKGFGFLEILYHNIKLLSDAMKLNSYEEMIMEFLIILDQYDILKSCTDLLGSTLNTNQAKHILSIILDIPKDAVDEAFLPTSIFYKSNLIELSLYHLCSLSECFDVGDVDFCTNMLNQKSDLFHIFQNSIIPTQSPTLDLKDFDHIAKQRDMIVSYLRKSIKSQSSGINILIYGVPGVGKSEFVALLAKKLGLRLLQIAHQTTFSRAIETKFRWRAYKTAQQIFADSKNLILYDEAEDIFERNRSFFSTKKQQNKAWINNILETNRIPTIWITNDIDSVDDAIVRRFDIVLEMPIPNRKKREEIIKKSLSGMLSDDEIKSISSSKYIAPAIISRAAKVAGHLDKRKQPDAIKYMINSTLKAQGYEQITTKNREITSKFYDLSFINSQIDLKKLTDGIIKNGSAKICIYGASGTGKSAYAKYIATKANKGYIIKSGSDLLSM